MYAPRDRERHHEIALLFSPRLPPRRTKRERKAGARATSLKFVRGTLDFFLFFRESRESVTQRAVHRHNRVTTSALIAVLERTNLFTRCLLRFVPYFFPLFDQLVSLIYVRRERGREIERHLSRLRIRRKFVKTKLSNNIESFGKF